MGSRLSPAELGSIISIARVTASLSILCNLSIAVYTVRRWDTVRLTPSRVILYWVMSSTLFPLSMLPANAWVPADGEVPSVACVTQGILHLYGLLASVLWVRQLATRRPIPLTQSS